MLRSLIVAILAIAAASCGGDSTSPSSTSGTTISIVSGASALTATANSPNPVTIARGSTVTWVNNDSTTHDQTADGGSFNTGNIAPGARASVTFQNAGSFPYHCSIHPNMIGTITVQ